MVMELTNHRLSSSKKKLRRLRCSVQNYGWGRVGSDTPVAILTASNSGSEVDSLKPYAEFWMGTHESGPSFVVKKSDDDGMTRQQNGKGNNGNCDFKSADGRMILHQNGKGNNGNFDFNGDDVTSLKNWIESNPDVLGDEVFRKWGGELPFLFKVLSIAKPLSIQAHPDKVLAKELHKLYPTIYKDGNHKPEMALALTEFEALCGFLEIEDLKNVLIKVPEIKELVSSRDRDQLLSLNGESDEETIRMVVRKLFTQIMSATKEQVAKVLFKVKTRLMRERKLTTKEKLFLRLEDEYPNDVGAIAAFFMNYVKLQPGEALCLDANELHAYISGDCVECMATSDNVVRAGLTPKLRDVGTLCSMLTYKLGNPHTLKGVPVNKYTKRYRPDFEEFEVDRCVLPQEGSSVSFAAFKGPSIYVITQGFGILITKSEEDDNGVEEESVDVGDVVFVAAGVEVTVKAATSRLELYRAGVNTEFL